jgi:hypothetical protein
MRKIKLIFFLSLLTSIAFSQQTPYGNEWIKSNQTYAKIKVSEKGVYKITYAQLQALGFFNSGINPKGFQIYYLGQEIPLSIEGDSDNSFDSSDYITFYGNPDNAKLEASLYQTGQQPNAEVSVFDDTASYFLTYDPNAQGKRYQDLNLDPTGITPENYINYTAKANFSTQYYPGLYVLDVMTYSDYIEGEGYLGYTFSIGGSQNQSLNTPNFYSGTAFKTSFESYVAGRSNATSTSQNGNNHHLNITIGSNVLKDTTYRGYSTIRVAKNLTNPTLASTTDVIFKSIDDLGAKTDFQAPAYIRITYPRNLDASNYNFLNFKLTGLNANSVLNFINTTSWSNSFIIDPNNSKRYKAIKTGSTSSFIVNKTNSELFVYNENAIKNTSLEAVQFNLVNPQSSTAKMLIVTHSTLLNAVNDLAAYKNSTGTPSSIVTTEELYNQFGYGIHSAIAIRNYCKFILDKAQVKPEFLFLIGKGYELSKMHLNDEKVPTMGFPPSDISITSKLIDNNLAPALATGRLSAQTPLEVNNYLEKIKLYNNQPNEIWRKNIINIAGGANSGEDASFSQSLTNFSNISSTDLFGSKTISYFKKVSDPITTNLTEKINTSIENGASLLTYLGHGSTISTAVSIGNPNAINNTNKLLFYYINGCSTGNAFVETSLGETYIFQKDKGAIAWIGTSSEGVASYLTGFGTQFYQNNFKTNYGKSVAQNLASSIRAYGNENDALNKIHAEQYIYLGDPSLSFYSPNKPDYEIKNQDISVSGPNVTANSSSFGLKLIVKNIGKALPNNLKVGITRTLSDNTTINYPIQTFNPVYNTDTLLFNIDNSISTGAGTNKFTVKLDPNNELDEFNEQNNSATFENFFPSNGVTIISPINFSIVGAQNPELTIQANDLFSKNLSYLFEIDTLNTFDTNWKKTSGLINGNSLITWKPNIVLENNKVYYWRARLNVAIKNGGEWQTGSFTYIADEGDGFNQGHYQQFSNLTLHNIELNNTHFEFTKTAFPIFIQTRGNTAPNNTERRLRITITVGALSFNSNEFTGLAIAAFDPTNSRKLYSYPSQYNFSNDGGQTKTGQFFFDTNNTAQLDSLALYLSNIPQGYYVTGLSGVNFSGKNLPQNIKNYLASLGLVKYELINKGEPYIFVSEKGNLSSSLLKEITADYSSTTPPQSQYISLNIDFLNNFNTGFYESEKIGPSTNWSSASFNFKSDNNDVISSSIIGIDENGVETTLKNNLSSSSVNITDVDAFKYPYLRIKSTVTDNVDKTAAQLLSYKVLYKSYPELSFNPEIANDFYSKELNEGDSLKLTSAISNLKNLLSDSVSVIYKITKADRTILNGLIGTFKPLDKNSNFKFNFKYSSLGLVGDNILQLTLQPKNKKDLLDFNNVLSYSFKVIKDQKNPLVDILFDGKHIINGETVAPKPAINIAITDENKFLLLNDTSAVNVYIKKQDGEYKRVSFSSNKIIIQKSGSSENNTISYLYQPEQLVDGIYTLKIQSKDKSGNALANDLLTDFEVINEQTITNVLPYPNPVINSTKFVFKVTGTVPDKMRIQISTASGKIVRVINKNELGNIRIGNNISDFSWDGTDSFGDRLANGVYFYQVFVENNDGNKVKKNNNSANAFFKNNVGKIYLMK